MYTKSVLYIYIYCIQITVAERCFPLSLISCDEEDDVMTRQKEMKPRWPISMTTCEDDNITNYRQSCLRVCTWAPAIFFAVRFFCFFFAEIPSVAVGTRGYAIRSIRIYGPRVCLEGKKHSNWCILHMCSKLCHVMTVVATVKYF